MLVWVYRGVFVLWNYNETQNASSCQEKRKIKTDNNNMKFCWMENEEYTEHGIQKYGWVYVCAMRVDVLQSSGIYLCIFHTSISK